MTPFALRVYKAVLTIPLGQVRTYKWVAGKIGSPRAYRAVGQALKNNPWPIIIPCHRVIASNGNLGGYSSGIGRKKKLLELEKEIKWCLGNKK
jgi:methylated-DNA-[protein]-cysteine S-methyltransferase